MALPLSQEWISTANSTNHIGLTAGRYSGIALIICLRCNSRKCAQRRNVTFERRLNDRWPLIVDQTNTEGSENESKFKCLIWSSNFRTLNIPTCNKSCGTSVLVFAVAAVSWVRCMCVVTGHSEARKQAGWLHWLGRNGVLRRPGATARCTDGLWARPTCTSAWTTVVCDEDGAEQVLRALWTERCRRPRRPGTTTFDISSPYIVSWWWSWWW